MRFLWQRRGLLSSTQKLHFPTISSTSPCRLQPIYYSHVSATIRLSKILVHNPSLAPLPHTCGPGHRGHQRHLSRLGPVYGQGQAPRHHLPHLFSAGPPKTLRFGAEGSPWGAYQHFGHRPQAEMEVDPYPQCPPRLVYGRGRRAQETL